MMEAWRNRTYLAPKGFMDYKAAVYLLDRSLNNKLITGYVTAGTQLLSVIFGETRHQALNSMELCHMGNETLHRAHLNK